MITFINTNENKKYNRIIKKIYESSFPKNEQVPFLMLSYRAKKDISDLFVILEKEEVIGMLCTVYYKDIVFLWYLAIVDDKRGKGYGSEVLQYAQKHFHDRRLILNIEEVDNSKEDYKERSRRKHFYTKNGFIECGFKTEEYGVVYEMLCYNGFISYQEYKEMMISYSGEKVFNKIYKLVK